ncbi:MAG: hypothetical protein KF767_18360 [Bdellovibrionaceae bacterium]|nr:hypothetical protein [Pseudobdellovibrionaceae bacterium]
MNTFLRVFASLLFAAPLFAGAQTLKLTEITYVCEVLLVADDVPADQGSWKFQASLKAEGSHGGETRAFTTGAHDVQVIADGTWLGIAWTQGGRKIAQGLFVMGPLDRALHRVGILFDPADNGAQVSIGCSEGALETGTP